MRFAHCRCWIHLAVLLGLAGVSLPAEGAELRAVLGMEYDDNPFERTQNGHGAWVSRLYADASAFLLKRPRVRFRTQFQGGLKRYWREDRPSWEDPGEVLTGDIRMEGQVRILPRVSLASLGDLKIKGVTRVSSEEAYVRGAAEGAIAAQLGRSISGTLRYRRGGDDSRDKDLPSLSIQEAGLELNGGNSRRMRASLSLSRSWLNYGRPALDLLPDGSGLPLKSDQADLQNQASVRLQGYFGILVDGGYAFLHSSSNSFGYGFKAHSLRLLITRHIAFQVDGQVYLTFQFRSYDDPLPGASGNGSEADEYEQAVLILKLSRQITSRFGISISYGSFRNGARQGSEFYRRHVYAFSFESSL